MNLGEHLLACAERHPEALAFVDGERRATYADLLAGARSAAGGLAALGVGPGDRVAVALRNRIETALLYWGAQWLGAVFVPLNWRLRPDELAYCVRDCGARALAIEGASAEAGAVLPDTPLIAVADAPAGEPLAAVDGPPEPAAVDDREPALMLYTSGTTGRPKGVPRSHRAERAAALAQLVQLELRPGDRTLGAMPLYHTMGMRSLLAASACGGVFCSQSEFRPRRCAGCDRARAPDLALPGADALPRPAGGAARAPARPLERARAGLCRRVHGGRARRALRRGLRARDVRQPLRLDRDLHVHDPRRPARQAGLRRPPGAERAHPARAARARRDARRASSRPARSGRSRARSRATRPSPATGGGPTPTRARSGTAGTSRATSASSTPTATSTWSGGSTT